MDRAEICHSTKFHKLLNNIILYWDTLLQTAQRWYFLGGDRNDRRVHYQCCCARSNISYPVTFIISLRVFFIGRFLFSMDLQLDPGARIRTDSSFPVSLDRPLPLLSLSRTFPRLHLTLQNTWCCQLCVSANFGRRSYWDNLQYDFFLRQTMRSDGHNSDTHLI
jgi:hypothetical protein